jgi:hypothetical protein
MRPIFIRRVTQVRDAIRRDRLEPIAQSSRAFPGSMARAISKESIGRLPDLAALPTVAASSLGRIAHDLTVYVSRFDRLQVISKA